MKKKYIYSFDLVLKPSKVSDSFHVTFSQLEKLETLDKVFLQFPRTSFTQEQFTIIKIFLSINCTMTGGGIFISLHKFNLLQWSFHGTILETVTLRLPFVTLFAKSTIDCAVTCGIFSDGTQFVPTW